MLQTRLLLLLASFLSCVISPVTTPHAVDSNKTPSSMPMPLVLAAAHEHGLSVNLTFACRHHACGPWHVANPVGNMARHARGFSWGAQCFCQSRRRP